MKNLTPISAPSGYAPAYALGFADADESYKLVSQEVRLPVATSAPPPPAMTGQASESGLAGPFEAVSGRVVSVSLSGDWSGTVAVLRSADGGASLVPLRVGGAPWAEYTAPGCEQAWTETEDGASYYLDIRLASGSVSYRVSQ